MPREKPKPESVGAPSEFAIGSPQPSGEYIYTLEIVMGMQRTLGKMEQAINTLTEDSRETRKKVNQLSHIIYAASVVVSIFVAVFIFVANKLADAVIAAATKK